MRWLECFGGGIRPRHGWLSSFGMKEPSMRRRCSALESVDFLVHGPGRRVWGNRWYRPAMTLGLLHPRVGRISAEASKDPRGQDPSHPAGPAAVRGLSSLEPKSQKLFSCGFCDCTACDETNDRSGALGSPMAFCVGRPMSQLLLSLFCVGGPSSPVGGPSPQ